MTSFDTNNRRQQELRLRPYADVIYQKLFKQVGIRRYSPDDRFELDLYHAIDVTLTLPSGLILNGQEKFLSHKFAKYESLTVEYEQNQFTGEQGDWFKLGCQFYFCGYETIGGDGFCKYILADWGRLVLMTHLGQITWNENKNKNGKAKASFRYISFDSIPKSCLWARYPNPLPKENIPF